MIDADTATIVFSYIALIIGLVITACAAACFVAVLGQPREQEEGERP
ncbi:MAG: hypothetical protein V4633_13440 [Pseudomonadota bacterium]